MDIGVLGAGTWGIALAKLLCENGHRVTVWSALPQEIEWLSGGHEHTHLPGVKLPADIEYTDNIEKALGGEFVLSAVPSAFLRSTVRTAAPFLREGQTIIDAAKGMESGTLFTMTAVIADEMKKCGTEFTPKLVALSGPTHAEEVAVGMPTSVVCACEDEECAKKAAALFMNSCMRVYTNTDVLGVELCGALKNVIALASGMISGMGYGDNTRAMLITRGIAEITRVGLAMGCKRRTFMGLAGIGDLIVTCTSRHSRNNRCGEYIGQGMTYKEASEKVGMVVEGYYALEAAAEISRRYGEMPIINAVYDVVMNGRAPSDAMEALMSRAMRSELD